MEDLKEVQLYIVNEYVFESKEDYEAALQEKKGIAYLGAQLNLKQTEKVCRLYQELIEKRVFVTPVGLDYLKTLRQAVGEREPERLKTLRPIPILSTEHKSRQGMQQYLSGKYEAQLNSLTQQVKKQKEKRRTSLILNIVLTAAVIAMFVVTASSSNPNILNYERVLQDKYAGWAEELSEKEQQLRQWENELEQREAQE